jgi:hypothetical protein
MSNAERQADHNMDNQNHRHRSTGFSISRFVFWLLQHDQLMAQGDVLSLQSCLATKAAEKGTERH